MKKRLKTSHNIENKRRYQRRNETNRIMLPANLDNKNQANNECLSKKNCNFFRNNNHEYKNNNKKFLGNKRNFSHSTEEDYIFTNQYNKKINKYNNKYISINRKVNDKIANNKFISKNWLLQIDLPIYSFKSDIMSKIHTNRVVIISGNTGCGKTTQIPKYIYESNSNNKILMTQPRRIAALSVAKRITEEMGEKLGERIGYHVKMNSKFSDNTKILVVTTGVFLEQIIHKNLNYTHIILDEVHERDIYTDLVLAMIKLYFEENPKSKIKIILMSATIAETKFSSYLKLINEQEVPIIKINESKHKIFEYNLNEIIQDIKNDSNIPKELKEKIVLGNSIFKNMIKDNPCFLKELFPICAALIKKIDYENYNNKNGILIFIPGLGEIFDLLNYLKEMFGKNNDYFEYLILHSQISDSDQEKIFKNTKKRKIILSTNIAESSITISNIDFIIDFCLVKESIYDINQYSSFLELKWCCKANCKQRKGRIGRVNTGFYFKLITEKLYNNLDEHAIPEILRTSLEIPILKLKIYESDREPNDILIKTITPPKEDIILRTIFQLEKMGALIKGNFKKEEYYSNSYHKKICYKSGVITKIGKIFAELPLDIKYSRLIIISYILGQIDLGITLSAILSQDKPIFFSSEKTNRLNLYISKNLYSFGKECDFITCYVAYKNWFYKYGQLLLNTDVKFDTKLKFIEKQKYLEMVNYTKENNLDLKVLKEVIKVENDIKRRLIKFGIYTFNLELYKNQKLINLKDNEKVLIFKIILAGTFYNQIYLPEYENTKIIDNSKDDLNLKKFRTLTMKNMTIDKALKIKEIFNEMIKPDIIVEMKKDETNKIQIEFNCTEALKKILFITASNNKKNEELSNIFLNNDFHFNNKSNQNEIKDINKDITLIQLNKDFEYDYRLQYFDECKKYNIIQNKDSINSIQIITKEEELKLCKLVTDNFQCKLNKNNSLNKYSRFSSVLPYIVNFDKLIMLIFGPKYEMICEKDNITGNNLRYKGFQRFEVDGIKTFTNEIKIEDNFVEGNNDKITFDYLITNCHLNIINEIRIMINKIMGINFLKKINKNEKENNKEDKYNFTNEASREEFNELYLNYKNNTNKIIEKIKFLLNLPKLKYISYEKYDELLKYINQVKLKSKRIQNITNKNESTLSVKNNFSVLTDNSNTNNEYYIKDESNYKSKTISNNYKKTFNKLKIEVKSDDFLQLHEPCELKEDINFTDKNVINELQLRNNKIHNIYKDYTYILSKIYDLSITNTCYLVCSHCHGEISILDEKLPIINAPLIGEHKVEKQWVNDNLNEIYIIEKNKLVKKYDIEDTKIEEFKYKLNEYKIEYDNLLCCISKQHIIGYTRKNENFIFFGCDIGIKYPDLSFELINNKENFMNSFIEYKEKSKRIIEYKNSDEFKESIICKLCNFKVKKDLIEFSRHIKSNEHKNKLNELRKDLE